MNRYQTVICLCLLSGCSLIDRTQPQIANQLPHEITYLHTVASSDESLPMIAEWYSGDMKNWKIVKSNNCNSTIFKLKPGSVIRIPASIAHQTSAMTADFTSSKKNSYRIAPKEPMPKANNSHKTAAPEVQQPEALPVEEPTPQEEISAKDELIDNLIGQNPQAHSELERSPESPTQIR